MFTGIVFKGGGVRGTAYAGALQVLEQKGIMQGISRVAGTSAGAITAMLVALKYDAAAIKTIVGNLDFSSLEDGWDPLRIPAKYGLFEGDAAFDWLEGCVSAKLGYGATFADLRAKGFLDLHVVATSLDAQLPFIFSADHTPNVQVSLAVRASMSIPLFFKAVQLCGISGLFVDGGVLLNYPIDIFGDDALGLYLTDFAPTAAPKVPYGDLKQYIKSLFGALMNSQDVQVQADPGIMKRTIRIDGLGVSATDFNLSDQVKTNLFNSGVACAEKFFA